MDISVSVRGEKRGLGGNWAEYANNMCAWHATGIHFNLLAKELGLSKGQRLESGEFFSAFLTGIVE